MKFPKLPKMDYSKLAKAIAKSAAYGLAFSLIESFFKEQVRPKADQPDEE